MYKPTIANYDEIAEALCWSPRSLKNIEARSVQEFTLQEGLVSMFERKNYPETVNVKMLERFLVDDDRACITTYPEGQRNSERYAGKWMAARLEIGGDPDPDGLGTIAFAIFGDGTVKQVKDWKFSEDIIVCWNAWDYSCDLNIPDTARKLQIADVSLDMLVKNSRLHPMPVARDSKEKNAIEEAQQNILDGKEQTVIAQGDTQELLDAIGNASSKIDVLALTDPASAVHIQNISQYREDLLRWFWNIYGMDSRGTSKRAQQSVEEVDQGGDLSMVIPMSRWRARQEEVEQVRAKCGAPEAACDFSTCWKSRIMEAVTIDEETAEKLDVENIVTEEQDSGENESKNGENAENNADKLTDEKEEENDEESETVQDD